MNNAFPLAPGEMFRRGVEGFQRNPVALLLAGLLSIAGYAVFGIPAQQMLDDGDRVPALILNIVGLVLGGTLAHPWYVVALASDRGEKADLAAALRSGDRFFAQLVGSFWFWAAFILGIQYLAGIPSIVVLIFYSFYGFIVADLRYGGMRALGTSVRLGEGRRIGIFAIAAMYGVFNFAAFLKQHPDMRAPLTDCLIGDLDGKDYDDLAEAMSDFAKLPEPLAHGRAPEPV